MGKRHDLHKLCRREVTRDREKDVVDCLVRLGGGIGRLGRQHALEPVHNPMMSDCGLSLLRVQTGVNGLDVIEEQLVALVVGLEVRLPRLDLTAEGGLELGEGGAVDVRKHISRLNQEDCRLMGVDMPGFNSARTRLDLGAGEMGMMKAHVFIF